MLPVSLNDWQEFSDQAVSLLIDSVVIGFRGKNVLLILSGAFSSKMVSLKVNICALSSKILGLHSSSPLKCTPQILY